MCVVTDLQLQRGKKNKKIERKCITKEKRKKKERE